MPPHSERIFYRCLLLFLAAVLAAKASSAETCAVPSKPSAAQALQLNKNLRDLKAIDMDTDLSAPAQHLLTQFKAALAATADTLLACQSAPVSPAAVEHDLADLLHANQPTPPQQIVTEPQTTSEDIPVAGIYGTGLTVHASLLAESPKILAIDFGFGTACGDDHLLQLFTVANNRWHEALRWQAPAYKDASGAFGDFFEYAVLTDPQNPAAWRLVAAHGKPWCTSRWSGFNLDLLAPTPDPTRPRVLWHKDHDYVRLETTPKLTAIGNTFTLRLELGTIESDVMTRPGIYRYRVVNDTPERIDPIATNARSCVDEWLQMPWPEAVHFADPANLAALRMAHTTFATHHSEGNDWTYSYGPVRACRDHPKHFQVQLDVDTSGKSPLGTHTHPSFYSVRQLPNGFLLLAADLTTPDSSCTGPNLMP